MFAQKRIARTSGRSTRSPSRRWQVPVAIVAGLGLAGSALCAPPPEEVTIATVPDAGRPFALHANVYRPDGGRARAPLLLFVHGHGGGYNFANGAPSYEYARALTARGIVVATIDYRPTDRLPGEIFDVKGYVRWFRAHADAFAIDPRRVGVWGTSRGGHLAALLATTGDVAPLEGDVGGNLDQSSRIQCAAIFYPLTDLLTAGRDLTRRFPVQVKSEDEFGLLGQLVGYHGPGGIAAVRTAAEKGDRRSPAWPAVERARLANPIGYVTADDPPIFLAHGARDTVVAVEQSQRLYERYLDAGLDAKLVVWSTGTHGNVGAETERAAADWLAACLLGDR